MNSISKFNIFNRHRKIERFLVSFMTVLIPLVIMTFMSIYNKFGIDSENLSAQAIYTSTVTFSRTQQTGEVSGVYTNKDKTRAMVLIKMSDPTLISSNAEDYSVYTTSVNLKQRMEPMKSKPTGSIYVFGNSGYIGLYFVDMKGIQPQIYKSTIRMAKEFTVVDPESLSQEVAAESYLKYDQADLYYNLGGTKATVLKALDEENISVQDLYVEAIGSPLDKAQRKILTDDVNRMSKLMLQIKEMKSRLETISIDGVGLVVPDLPETIASDTFSGFGDDVKMSTDYVFAGGMNFNWQDVNFRDGYFNSFNNKQVNPDDLSLSKWLVWLQNSSTSTEEALGFEIDWVMSDGTSLTQFVMDMGTGNTAVGEMETLVQTYTTMVNEYIELKRQYQVTDLKGLVSLDISLTNATSNVDSIADDHFNFY